MLFRSDADCTRNFSFTIRLTDAGGTPLTGSYYFWGTDKAGQIEDGDTFVLHHDEEITIQGLPAGTRFSVTETPETGWYISPASGGIEGTIQKSVVSSACFTNSRQPVPEQPKTGALTIKKTVTGSGGDRDKEFTFTVTLAGADGEYVYHGSKQGTIRSGGTITLKHGESVTISGLPVGTRYTVTESGADGYTVTKTGETGTIAEDTSAAAAFTNQKDGPPPDKPTPPGGGGGPEDPPEDPKDPEEPKEPETPEEPEGPEEPEVPEIGRAHV